MGKHDFFAHAVPETAPSYILPEAADKVNATCKSVRARMALLQETLDSMPQLRGEVFSEIVRPFMGLDSTGKPKLDSMSVKELRTAVELLAPTVDERSIPDRLEWPNCITFVDTAFTTNEEWEVLRMFGIGGSDSACIIGRGYNSSRKIYHDKIGTDMHEKIDEDKQFIFEYGHKVEPLVIDTFCRKSGAHRVHETRMFAHKDYPFLTANVDEIVRFDNGKLFVFEAKTCTGFKKDCWRNGNIPAEYAPQCRKYPIVLNDERICGTYIACIYGNTIADFSCSFLERDPEIERIQLENEIIFWQEHVLAGVEPPLCGDAEKDLAVASAKAGPADDNAPTVQIDPEEYGYLMEEYMRVSDMRDTAQKKADGYENRLGEIKAQLIELLGPATKGVCPCAPEMAPERDKQYEYVFTYKHAKSTKKDMDLLRIKYPQIFDEVVTVEKSENRRFVFGLKRVAAEKKKA